MEGKKTPQNSLKLTLLTTLLNHQHERNPKRSGPVPSPTLNPSFLFTTLHPSKLCLPLILLMFARTPPFETLFLGVYNTMHHYRVLLFSLQTSSFSRPFLLTPLPCTLSTLLSQWLTPTLTASTVSSAEVTMSRL